MGRDMGARLGLVTLGPGQRFEAAARHRARHGAAETFGRAGAYTGDEYLTVDRPEQVTEVLLIPNDQSTHDRRTCEDDIKDGGGVHPPDEPDRGEKL